MLPDLLPLVPQILTAEELQLQWSGAPVNRACIDELRRYGAAESYIDFLRGWANADTCALRCCRVAVVHPEVAAQARWLWDILYSLDDEKRAKYYRFVTGSSRRPASVSLTTHRMLGHPNGFAVAHCLSVTGIFGLQDRPQRGWRWRLSLCPHVFQRARPSILLGVSHIA